MLGFAPNLYAEGPTGPDRPLYAAGWWPGTTFQSHREIDIWMKGAICR